jgi:hypothetical protein
MLITADGHFVFQDDIEVLSGLGLMRAIHKDGFVNTQDSIWKTWVSSDFGKKTAKDNIIVLIWSTVFLQRLTYSLLCHIQGVNP